MHDTVILEAFILGPFKFPHGECSKLSAGARKTFLLFLEHGKRQKQNSGGMIKGGV